MKIDYEPYLVAVPSYFLERANGQWEGRWYCKDEDRTYRRAWDSPSQCEKWCKRNGFRLVMVNDGLGVLRLHPVTN